MNPQEFNFSFGTAMMQHLPPDSTMVGSAILAVGIGATNVDIGHIPAPVPIDIIKAVMANPSSNRAWEQTIAEGPDPDGTRLAMLSKSRSIFTKRVVAKNMDINEKETRRLWKLKDHDTKVNLLGAADPFLMQELVSGSERPSQWYSSWRMRVSGSIKRMARDYGTEQVLAWCADGPEDLQTSWGSSLLTVWASGHLDITALDRVLLLTEEAFERSGNTKTQGDLLVQAWSVACVNDTERACILAQLLAGSNAEVNIPRNVSSTNSVAVFLSSSTSKTANHIGVRQTITLIGEGRGVSDDIIDPAIAVCNKYKFGNDLADMLVTATNTRYGWKPRTERYLNQEQVFKITLALIDMPKLVLTQDGLRSSLRSSEVSSDVLIPFFKSCYQSGGKSYHNHKLLLQDWICNRLRKNPVTVEEVIQVFGSIDAAIDHTLLSRERNDITKNSRFLIDKSTEFWKTCLQNGYGSSRSYTMERFAKVCGDNAQRWALSSELGSTWSGTLDELLELVDSM